MMFVSLNFVSRRPLFRNLSGLVYASIKKIITIRKTVGIGKAKEVFSCLIKVQ